MSWQPTATLPALQQRAIVNQAIRQFLADRNILELDVPVLSPAATVDPFIDSLLTKQCQQTYYLQTSPEFFLKRFLVAHSHDVYYLGKAFRQGETGRRHRPEFTLLEWYRVGKSMPFLMGEVRQLIQTFLPELPHKTYSYREVYQQYLSLDPHLASIDTLRACVEQHIELHNGDETNSDPKTVTPELAQAIAHHDKNQWLDLLFSHCIEPHLTGIVTIYDYPASQAALSRIQTDDQDQLVAKRFEVYVNGIELANGYHELTDGAEQERRFKTDQTYRQYKQLPAVPYDSDLVNALNEGQLPDCAGVALGIDRLLMACLGVDDIAEVVSFTP